MAIVSKRWFYAVWVVFIGIFAVMHALNLAADFPNHTPWHIDWAKYTDEGWYGNAAIRAHLFGHWYVPGDFNPAPAVPLWPFLEWILFFFTGVTVEAARGLAVALFFANLVLSYTLLRPRGSKVDGVAGVDAAGDQPVSLLLQPPGDSRAASDDASAVGSESRGKASADEEAGGHVGGCRRVIHADDVDQDDGNFPGARDRVGHVCGILGSRRCIVGYKRSSLRTLVSPVRIALRGRRYRDRLQ